MSYIYIYHGRVVCQALCPECGPASLRQPTPSSPTEASCTCRPQSSRPRVKWRLLLTSCPRRVFLWLFISYISYICASVVPDCEGAGERFQVTTRDLSALSKPSSAAAPATKAAVTAGRKEGSEAKDHDFFGANPAYLTVSGQVSLSAAPHSLPLFTIASPRS
jgi:hypothetical protein